MTLLISLIYFASNRTEKENPKVFNLRVFYLLHNLSVTKHDPISIFEATPTIDRLKNLVHTLITYNSSDISTEIRFLAFTKRRMNYMHFIGLLYFRGKLINFRFFDNFDDVFLWHSRANKFFDWSNYFFSRYDFFGFILSRCTFSTQYYHLT